MGGKALALRVTACGAAFAALVWQAQAQPGDDGAGGGKAAYASACATCHGGDLAGSQFGPPLKGQAFKASWGAQAPDVLLSFIQTKMPPGAPGSLGAETYAGIAAYIRLSADLSAQPVAPGAGSAAVYAIPEPNPGRRMPVIHDAAYQAATAKRQALLAAMTPVSDAMLRHPSQADWLVWRGDDQAHGYSGLKQIDRRSVAGLRSAWTWSLPLGQNEITPLVHDGVMFIESGNAVQALDAATGDLLWQYIHAMPDRFNNGRYSRTKSMAIFEGRLYAPFPDGRLVALDVKTGAEVWNHPVVSAEMADRRGGAEGVALLMDGGPIVADGKVVIGVSLGQNNSKGGCFILALDARTGNEVWRFDTIARPGQPGGDSWNGHPVDQRFGAGVWTAGSYDADLNLVYFGTGNTYDTATLLQPDPKARPANYGLYTDSTLALDARTGKLVWYYQHVHRDVWDLDWVFERTLVTLPVAGKPRKLVVTAGKTALFDALDRATGQYLFSKDLGLQNEVIAIDPKTGEKTLNPAIEPQAGKTEEVCPSSFGARNWPATSFNPATGILYVPLAEACMDYTYQPHGAEETAAGGVDIQMTPHPRPGSDGRIGRVEAVNLRTGKVVWTRRQRSALSSSMLATAGGVVFNGAHDRYFTAYDDATGATLWRSRLNAPPSSSPITYTVGGRQYVAVVAGGGGPMDSSTGRLTPELDSPSAGVTLWVFALPRPPATP